MTPAKSVGRTIGMLLFVQLVGLTLPFILLMPMTTTAGSLENAAGLAFQIRVAVLLLFANGALTIGIAIAAFPVVREYGYRMALWFLALSVIWFSMQAVDNAHILSMLSLSQRYAEEGASNPELFGALGALVRSSRGWAHYTELLVIDTWFFVFYGLLFRFSLVPRPLAGFGLVMVIVHAAGITLPRFIGYSSVPPLGFSLALSHLALGSWLIAKGFDEARRTLPVDERGVELSGP
jgi:hypothetical protein